MNYTIENPKGIDYTIQKTQNYLYDNLNWGDIDVYGRIYANSVGKKALTLEAYIGRNEYKDVFTNDYKNANIFFIEDEVHDTKEGIRFTNSVKIVFMVNLHKIMPDTLHRADMEVEIRAIELLRNRPGFEFEKLEKGLKKCLGEYHSEEIKLNDTHPFHVFAITGKISYHISCLTN